MPSKYTPPLHKFRVIIYAIVIITLPAIAFLSDGTMDSGDSVNHYLYAHYAFTHPANFLNHWAKPAFVLVAAIPAQFGFIGMKLCNLTLGIITAVILFRIAVLHYDLQVAAWLPLLLFLAPKYTIALFSGYTEILFGAVWLIAYYQIIKSKVTTGFIYASFLPLIRTEGLILVAIFGVWAVYKRKIRQLVYLITATVIYSLVGGLYFQNYIWFFSDIPYLQPPTYYGSGSWFHFFDKFVYVVGIPLYILMVLGLIRLMIHIKDMRYQDELLLIAAGFGAYFLAHVVFWRLGVFGSFGLERVLIAIVPAGILLAGRALDWLPAWPARMAWGYCLVFPFTDNPAAFHLEKDFTLSPDQKLMDSLALRIKSSPELATQKCYYAYPYAAIALGIDPWNSKQSGYLSGDLTDFSTNDLLIWDSWFAPVEGKIAKPSPADTTFRLLDSLQSGKDAFFLYQYQGKRKTN
jgi:hydrogenase/urease accessory protein HupE